METVAFYFDFGSPNAYLSHKIIPAIESRTEAMFEYVPVLLGGIFKMTNNQSPMAAFSGVRNKLEYERIEMRRFVMRHRLDVFQMNPHFPVNTLHIMRGAVAAQALGVFKPYVDQVFADMWERGRKMDDPSVIRSSLEEAGLPADEILRLGQTDDIKARLVANTEQAVASGAFGSPTFIIRGELYFGKDRLRDVEDLLLTRS